MENPKMGKIYQKNTKIDDFRGLQRESARKRAETPRGAPQARRRRACRHRLCCDRETKLARNKKEAPAAADILPHQACPENATARPNRHC
jgi:hypothetical protein